MIDEIIRNERVDLTMVRRFLITQIKAPPTIIAAVLRLCTRSYARAGIFTANDTTASAAYCLL